MPKRSVLLAVFALTAIAAGLLIVHGTTEATIEWSDVHQTIDGFGGAAADFLSDLTPAQADFFFTPAGIGLSILRIQIIPDMLTCNTDFRNGGCSDTDGHILNGELRSAQSAVARGAIVIATPWSPPGAYKSNGSFKNGGTLLRSHYTDWAKELASFVVMMARNGVPIYAVSVQNEPDLTTNYGSCRFTAQEIHDFVPFLYTSLHSVGAGSTKIMIAEESYWADDLTSLAMADRGIAPQIGIIAAHGYHGQFQPYPTGAARLWQTEDSSQAAAYDGDMTDGMSWAITIHRYLAEANVNAWIWWFLSDMPQQGEGTDNAALTDIKGNFPKRAWVTGQWSRFVRPGWYRIGVRNSGALRITAFRDPGTRSFAIVAVNPDHEPVAETFVLDGFTANSVTPWITSTQWSLTAQSPVSVSRGTFIYTLPASSVTTFSGVAVESH